MKRKLMRYGLVFVYSYFPNIDLYTVKLQIVFNSMHFDINEVFKNFTHDPNV